MRGFDRCDDVARIAARRDREQHVVRVTQPPHLLREDLVVVVVVRDRGERRCVGGERDRGQRRALHLETIEELRRKMLAVGGRAAVAAREDLAVAFEALHHALRGFRDRSRRAHPCSAASGGRFPKSSR